MSPQPSHLHQRPSTRSARLRVSPLSGRTFGFSFRNQAMGRVITTHRRGVSIMQRVKPVGASRPAPAPDPDAKQRRLVRPRRMSPRHGDAPAPRRSVARPPRPGVLPATRASATTSPNGAAMSITYRDSGVDIEEGERLVEKIAPLARATRREEVLAGVGGFASLVTLPRGYRDPVLVSGTDGVGTKLKIAFLTGRHDTVGQDLVAMCANDVA